MLFSLASFSVGRMGVGGGWILTVPRPPFGGSHCGAVYHKLLGGCVVGGFSLQALKIRPLESRRGVRHWARISPREQHLETRPTWASQAPAWNAVGAAPKVHPQAFLSFHPDLRRGHVASL